MSLKFPHPIAVFNSVDAEGYGIAPGNIVSLVFGDSHASAVAMTSSTIVSPGECALSEELARRLGVAEGDVVGVKPI